jgi:hypothetical protein
MTHHHPLTPTELEDIPIFPLPRLVFFPGTALPLHLFEPRYQRMIEDCLRQGGGLAVTMLEPGHEAEYDMQPPMKSVGCVGRVMVHEKLPDGRFNVVVQGLSRVRLEEHPMAGRPYRRGRAVPLDDEGTAEPTQRAALLSCASAVVVAVRRTHPEFTLHLDPHLAASVLTDTVADGLVADANVRQRVLETLNVPARLDLVMDAVGELMAMLSAPTSKDLLH